jgi:hypothetical protein
VQGFTHKKKGTERITKTTRVSDMPRCPGNR